MADKLNAPFKPPKSSNFEKNKTVVSTSTKRSRPGSFPIYPTSKKPFKVRSQDDEDVCAPLSASQLNRHTISSPSTSGGSQESSERQYYLCVYRNPQTKMHKTWDLDGFIVLRPGAGVELFEMDSKRFVSSDSFSTRKFLSNGMEFFVGNKEVQITERTERDKIYLKKNIFSNTNQGKIQGNVPTRTAFKPPKVVKTEEKVIPTSENQKEESISSSSFYGPNTSTRTVGMAKQSQDSRVTPLYSPKEGQVLIAMDRPNEQHELEFNRRNCPVVDVHINPEIAGRLRPHQIEGVKFLYNSVMQMRTLFNARATVNGEAADPNEIPNSAGAILADAMGVGKTVQTIAVIDMLLRQSCYFEPNRPGTISRAMIICPTSLVKNWKIEFIKWLGKGYKVQCIEEKTNIKSVINGAFEVLIINYDKARLYMDMLMKTTRKFGLLVCDEAHKLKGSNSKTAEAFGLLRMDKRILLTGTPIQNNLMEFYTMINFIAPLYLGDEATFKKNFEMPITRGRKPHCPEKHRQLAEERSTLLQQITAPLLLRREANTNTQFLPTKHELVIFCNPSKLQHRVYSALTDGNNMLYNIREKGRMPLEGIMVLRKLCSTPDLLITDLKSRGNSGQNVRTILGDVQDILPASETFDLEDSGKLCLLMRLLRGVRKNSKDKVIVVSNFTTVLDIVEIICKKVRYPFLRLDGKVKQDHRMSIVNRFNMNGSDDSFIMLLSTKAGGVGLNLIGANRLVLLDGDWNPANDAQAMARIHREGQKKECFIYRFILSGTIEEKIFQRQISKLGLSDVLLQQSDDDPSNSSQAAGKQGKVADDFSEAELFDIFRYENIPCATHNLLHCPCQGKGEVKEQKIQSNKDGEEVNLPSHCDFMPASQVQMKADEEKKKEDRRKLASLFSWAHHDFSKADHSVLTQDEIVNRIVEKALKAQGAAEPSANSSKPAGAILYAFTKKSSRSDASLVGEMEILEEIEDEEVLNENLDKIEEEEFLNEELYKE